MFSVKKCLDCQVSNPPRLPMVVFRQLHDLPDPLPHGEHYDDFDSVYETETTEVHRPSLSFQKLYKGHGMPLDPSAQTAKNANLVLQYEDCSKWRVVHSKHKLKSATRENVVKAIESLLYSCGSVLHIDGIELKVVFMMYIGGAISHVKTQC